MEWKFVAIGFIAGIALGWMRMKSAPTTMTPKAKGF
jgi:hypothetical protein